MCVLSTFIYVLYVIHIFLNAVDLRTQSTNVVCVYVFPKHEPKETKNERKL